LRGKLRIVQQGAAEVVHQQRLHHEALLRVEAGGGAQGAQHGAEQIDEVGVLRGQRVQIPALMHQFLQRLAGQGS
jgi:hypothetical protein